ncbi:MAG: hypothetical protein GWP10_14200 [Nitrospiraceae bacterium]|nr:hypothetical protein [Nitrospiraceae bacterium]
MSTIYGWVGKILWVDLSSGKVWESDTLPYAQNFIGGRGIAAKLMWDITSNDSSARPLIFMTGPLGGTIAPFGGRTLVAGYAPQGYPHEWYSRSTFGGYWGPELKYAGYDGIVILGSSPDPVYIWINDGQVEIRDAASLWGLGHFDIQRNLKKILGNQVRIVSIGQAGENLSRISVIETETESAAGQGGFGAVMGAKQLKAIAVKGTGAVQVADAALLMHRSKVIREELRLGDIIARNATLDRDKVAKYGERWAACTQQCAVLCASRQYAHVPGPISGQERAGQFHCCAPAFGGADVLGDSSFYNWKMDFESAFDIACMANDFGINHWEIQFGLIPWLKHSQEIGARTHLDGIRIDANNPRFWAELVRKIAFREGSGNVLAEGAYRAAREWNLGEAFIAELYAGWGYAGHLDGHGDRINKIVFPFWLTTGLQWAVDTRDPCDSSHGYRYASMIWSPFGDKKAQHITNPDKDFLSWEQLGQYSEHIYGTPYALDPYSGYMGKAEPAVWHANRSALKDSLPVCDWMFPSLFSLNQKDGWARAGGMEGIDFEWHLFTATTGMDLTKEDFYRVGERICNLERALQIRDFKRTRTDDESIIPYLARKEWWQSPVLKERVAADPEQFRELLSEFYRLRGWSVETGRPDLPTLQQLGLSREAKLLKDKQLIK